MKLLEKIEEGNWHESGTGYSADERLPGRRQVPEWRIRAWSVGAGR